MIIVQFLVYCALVGMVLSVILLTRNPLMSIGAALYALFLSFAFHEMVIYFSH